MNAIPEAITTFQAGLSAMVGQPRFGIAPSAYEDGDIVFADADAELKPFEPVIKPGRMVDPEVISSKFSSLEPEYIEGIGLSAPDKGLIADYARMKSLLTRPLGEYLPEKDPRKLAILANSQARAWEFVRERSASDLIDAIRLARAVNFVSDPMYPDEMAPIGRHGPTYIGELIWDKVSQRCAADCVRLEHQLVSALILYEIAIPVLEPMLQQVKRLSPIMREYSERYHYEAAAMIAELAFSMIPEVEGDGDKPTVRAAFAGVAASNWKWSLRYHGEQDTLMWRLFRGMRMAWDGKDMEALLSFHDTHGALLRKGDDPIGAGNAYARKAWSRVEALRQDGYDLGDSRLTYNAWHVIGSDLSTAARLFNEGGEVALQAHGLSEDAYRIREMLWKRSVDKSLTPPAAG